MSAASGSNHGSDNSNPQAGAGRPLPKKEADTFRGVVKHYEMKQYKKAIKQADAILKKFPNHGETLAMKGLTLNYMSKRDEAHALVKEGLRYDMRYVSVRRTQSEKLLGAVAAGSSTGFANPPALARSLNVSVGSFSYSDPRCILICL